MPIHLLDTDTILETIRKAPHAGLVEFLEREPNIRVSVVLFQEIMVLIEDAPEPTRAQLNRFLDSLLSEFGPTAIAIDMEVAKAAGALTALAQSGGHDLGTTDTVMAATALVHNAILVTRNTERFKALNVSVLNPFQP